MKNLGVIREESQFLLVLSKGFIDNITLPEHFSIIQFGFMQVFMHVFFVLQCPDIPKLYVTYKKN